MTSVEVSGARPLGAALTLTALIATTAALSGCAGGFRSDQPIAQAYVLRVPAVRAEPISGMPSLQIARPLPHPGLESDRIIAVRADRQLDYLAASRWAASLPELVESLLVDTLRHGGALAAVHDSFGGFAPDYVLRVTIRRFDADYSQTDGAPRAVVALDCVLGRRGDARVLASFSAEESVVADSNRVRAIVAAFEGAATGALQALAERTYAVLRTDAARESAPS